jgi:hypothetical protein
MVLIAKILKIHIQMEFLFATNLYCTLIALLECLGKKFERCFLSNWSGKRDSNSRPQPWQGCALPLSYSRLKFDCYTIFVSAKHVEMNGARVLRRAAILEPARGAPHGVSTDGF